MSARTTRLMREARTFVRSFKPDWTVEWDRAVRRGGCCHYSTKTITLSLPLAEINSDEEFWNTLKHETAHAIVGKKKQSHGPEWRAQFITLGGNGSRTHSKETPPARWIGTCPNGHESFRNRKTSKADRVSCGKCSRVFNPEYRFTWRLNVQAKVRVSASKTAV